MGQGVEDEEVGGGVEMVRGHGFEERIQGFGFWFAEHEAGARDAYRVVEFVGRVGRVGVGILKNSVNPHHLQDCAQYMCGGSGVP